MSRGRPTAMPASMAAPMSSVCTWQFQMPSPPTTTIESPRSPHADLKPSIVLVGRLEEVHDLVAEVGDAAALAAAAVPACAPTAIVRCTSSAAGSGVSATTCRHAASSSSNPRPPASTTPGLAQHGQQVGGAGHGVAGRAGGALEHADQRGLALARPPRSTDSAAERTTVRMVPSTGRSTAS